MTNLFKKELLEIFKYATKMVFDIRRPAAKQQISLYSLLSIIKQSSLNEIILHFGMEYDITIALKEKFNQANYTMSPIKNGCIILKK